MTKKQLLELAKTYASHTGLALSTVSTYAADAGGFFKGLEGGAAARAAAPLTGCATSCWR